MSWQSEDKIDTSAHPFDDVALENLPSLFSSIAVLVALLIAPSALLTLDHGTTIELYTWPVSFIVVAITAICCLWLLFHWFWPRPAGVAPPRWNLKHDSPGLWTLQGLGVAFFLSAIVGWTAYAGLNNLAQHLPGRQIAVSGTLVSLQQDPLTSPSCLLNAEFSIDWGTTIEVCAIQRSGAKISEVPLSEGQPVNLVVTDNVLGKVVARVEVSAQRK
jgi:hypothetical protein